MVEIRNLTKTYGRYRALNNLNLHIDKGDGLEETEQGKQLPCVSYVDSLKLIGARCMWME